VLSAVLERSCAALIVTLLKSSMISSESCIDLPPRMVCSPRSVGEVVLLSTTLDSIKCMVASERIVQVPPKVVYSPRSPGEVVLVSTSFSRRDGLVTSESHV
jgi:hypothetical protein